MYPIKLQPAFQDYLWGGNKMKKMFHKQNNLSVTAESWELSCHPSGESVVLNGAFQGQKLKKVIEENPYFVHKNFTGQDEFPILIKFLDPAKPLSVQVHPSDQTANKAKGETGKSEMWYVVKAEPKSFLYYGLNQKISPKELIQRSYDGTVCDVLNKVYVQEGDVFYILPGTIHSLGTGIIVAEVQQSSDTTFRIYDFGRKDAKGNYRELHVERAAEVVDYTPVIPDKTENNNMIKTDDFSFSNIFECEYFKVAKVENTKKVTLNCSKDSFHSLLFLKGNGTILYQGEKYDFSSGESYFLPAGLGVYQVEGNCQFLLSTL